VRIATHATRLFPSMNGWCDRNSVHCADPHGIGVRNIGGWRLRPRASRFEELGAANARHAAVFGKLRVVNRRNRVA
jgi:hypothetical protein